MRLRATGLCALLAAAGLALALAGCSGSASAGGSGGDGGKGYVSGDGRSITFPAGDREPAPPVRGRTLSGQELDLASLRGKVIVLNIWGSWCAPCRKEAPSLERIYQETRSQGVEFVGLNSRDTDAAAKAFQRTFGVTYPSIVDADGVIQSRFRGKLAAAALPTTYVIDREGQVAARATDLLTDVKLRELIQHATGKP
jgi:thiol-disulfide isomerase/thioredoxin